MYSKSILDMVFPFSLKHFFVSAAGVTVMLYCLSGYHYSSCCRLLKLAVRANDLMSEMRIEQNTSSGFR